MPIAAINIPPFRDFSHDSGGHLRAVQSEERLHHLMALHHQKRHHGRRGRAASGRVSSGALIVVRLPMRRRISTSSACARPRASISPCNARLRHSSASTNSWSSRNSPRSVMQRLLTCRTDLRTRAVMPVTVIQGNDKFETMAPNGVGGRRQ